MAFRKFISFLKKIIKMFLYLILFIIVGYFVFSLIVKPSLQRDWNLDQVVLSESIFDGEKVLIKNIRNINYRNVTDYDVRYYDKTFDLNNVESLWYMVEPFDGYAGAAHTLLSFGFKGGEFISISAEIRKQKGESFSAVRGLFRQYEIVYMVADEKDVIKLRSNYRKDKVFLYPVRANKEHIQKLFISMLNRANKLAIEPEFYNTLTNTCSTNIVSHINELVPGKIPFSLKVLMPAYSDELAYELGLIDNSVPLLKLREKYQINDRALKYADDPMFSLKIRQ